MEEEQPQQQQHQGGGNVEKKNTLEHIKQQLLRSSSIPAVPSYIHPSMIHIPTNNNANGTLTSMNTYASSGIMTTSTALPSSPQQTSTTTSFSAPMAMMMMEEGGTKVSQVNVKALTASFMVPKKKEEEEEKEMMGAEELKRIHEQIERNQKDERMKKNVMMTQSQVEERYKKEIDLAVHEALHDINQEKRLELKRRMEQDFKWESMLMGGKLTSEEIERMKADRLLVDAMFQEREKEIVKEVKASFEVKLLYLQENESGLAYLKKLKELKNKEDIYSSIPPTPVSLLSKEDQDQSMVSSENSSRPPSDHTIYQDAPRGSFMSDRFIDVDSSSFESEAGLEEELPEKEEDLVDHGLENDKNIMEFIRQEDKTSDMPVESKATEEVLESRHHNEQENVLKLPGLTQGSMNCGAELEENTTQLTESEMTNKIVNQLEEDAILQARQIADATISSITDALSRVSSPGSRSPRNRKSFVDSVNAQRVKEEYAITTPKRVISMTKLSEINSPNQDSPLNPVIASLPNEVSISVTNRDPGGDAQDRSENEFLVSSAISKRRSPRAGGINDKDRRDVLRVFEWGTDNYKSFSINEMTTCSEVLQQYGEKMGGSVNDQLALFESWHFGIGKFLTDEEPVLNYIDQWNIKEKDMRIYARPRTDLVRSHADFPSIFHVVYVPSNSSLRPWRKRLLRSDAGWLYMHKTEEVISECLLTINIGEVTSILATDLSGPRDKGKESTIEINLSGRIYNFFTDASKDKSEIMDKLGRIREIIAESKFSRSSFSVPKISEKDDPLPFPSKAATNDSLSRKYSSLRKSKSRAFRDFSPDQLNLLRDLAKNRLVTLLEENSILPASQSISILHEAAISKFFKVLQPDKKRDKFSSTTIFGVHLTVLAERTGRADQVPLVYTQLIEFLEKEGVKTEGIMRVAGSTQRMKTLRTRIDSYGIINDFDGYSVHDVASTLKQLLRELPEPVFTHRLFRILVAAGKCKNEPVLLQIAQLLCLIIDPVHRNLLEKILGLLALITAYARPDGLGYPGNLMDSYNLATVMAPNLIREKKDLSDVEREVDNNNSITHFVKCMIDNERRLWRVANDLAKEVIQTPL